MFRNTIKRHENANHLVIVAYMCVSVSVCLWPGSVQMQGDGATEGGFVSSFFHAVITPCHQIMLMH